MRNLFSLRLPKTKLVKIIYIPMLDSPVTIDKIPRIHRKFMLGKSPTPKSFFRRRKKLSSIDPAMTTDEVDWNPSQRVKVRVISSSAFPVDWELC